ncbi:hypothetical protein CHS0354_025211 [Potamilus streckersoni]|uniref:Uncharacterized protein n=1 Tax=Potamilus streckersoni TaxID=2493646 RepID=A0AAE0VFG6_9BIVA|nr:hypothetical protein CHS0354_025211 [Potamilus streckersoni]
MFEPGIAFLYSQSDKSTMNTYRDSLELFFSEEAYFRLPLKTSLHGLPQGITQISVERLKNKFQKIIRLMFGSLIDAETSFHPPLALTLSTS